MEDLLVDITTAKQIDIPFANYLRRRYPTIVTSGSKRFGNLLMHIASEVDEKLVMRLFVSESNLRHIIHSSLSAAMPDIIENYIRNNKILVLFRSPNFIYKIFWEHFMSSTRLGARRQIILKALKNYAIEIGDDKIIGRVANFEADVYTISALAIDKKHKNREDDDDE